MSKKCTSWLALVLAVAFVAGMVTQVTATDCDKAQAAQEQTAEKKVEMKGKVEEEKGKATLEMKKTEPEAEAPEATAPADKPQ